MPTDVPGSALFVGNLTWETTDEEFKAAFAKYDPLFVAVTRDEEGKSAGHGVVSVADDAARDACIAAMTTCFARPPNQRRGGDQRAAGVHRPVREEDEEVLNDGVLLDCTSFGLN